MGASAVLAAASGIKMMKLAVVLLLGGIAMHTSDSDVAASLGALDLDGHVSFHDVHDAAGDFGNRRRRPPAAVLHPGSVADVAATVRHVFQMGRRSGLTIAARGHAHSLQGQAQAPGGIVVRMEALAAAASETAVVGRGGEDPYVDVSGGEVWINVLRETLKYGLAPKSWTDYLHLTVGGTLSNAGVSGQAFRHGPQISNVRQLQVVTGKGEVLDCSERENADLFHAVLGGLGQFGIITRARISLEPAPQMVKWIRVLYSDFAAFAEDQERLISGEKTGFDYVEGFVIINRTGLLNNWRSSFNPQDSVLAGHFSSDGRTLYCLEMTKNYNPADVDTMNQEVDVLLSQLRYIPSTLFQSEVPYLQFLDRVHASELQLRSRGLWDVPHPWLNLLVPRASIAAFAREVFGNILTDSSSGPILLYPVNKSRWDNRTSAVTPDADIFYLVAFLSSAPPSADGGGGGGSLERLLEQNERIVRFCGEAGIQMKQYLPHYGTPEEWKAHFGRRQWETLVRRKAAYDPLAILAPGHGIFRKAAPLS